MENMYTGLGCKELSKQDQYQYVGNGPPTPLPPNPTFTLTYYQLTVVGLGEGWVGGCPHTDIDPIKLTLSGCKSHMFSPGFNSKGRLAQTTVLLNQ